MTDKVLLSSSSSEGYASGAVVKVSNPANRGATRGREQLGKFGLGSREER